MGTDHHSFWYVGADKGRCGTWCCAPLHQHAHLHTRRRAGAGMMMAGERLERGHLTNNIAIIIALALSLLIRPELFATYENAANYTDCLFM